MLFNCKNSYERERAKVYLEQLVEQNAVVEITKKRLNRTIKQNKYFHVLVGFYASVFGNSMQEVKEDLIKKRLCPDIFWRTHLNKRNIEVRFLRSTSTLDTKEMTIVIERFRNYSSAEAGLYLPSPEEYEYLLYAEQEMKAYEEYLYESEEV